MPKKSATIPRNRAELTQPSKPAQFLIVGIGASAGGLEAFGAWHAVAGLPSV